MPTVRRNTLDYARCGILEISYVATRFWIPILCIRRPCGRTSASGTRKTEVIIVAGGGFCCVESDFDKVDGVLARTSGYIGGKTDNPTYKQVVSGNTGPLEAVAIRFNPAKVSYEKLLDVFWRSVDPTDGGGEFCDRGASYSPCIFA